MQLTTEQEKKILEIWNRTPNSPPGLKEIIKEVSGQELDGRTEFGRAVKCSLAKFSLKAKPAGEYSLKTAEIKLTDEQQSYVTNNVATMNALEIARIIFHNSNLTNLNAETRVVNELIKTLDTTVIYNAEQNAEIPSKDYDAPNTIDKVLRRVNKYINFVLDKDKLTSKHKKNLEMLINYLHTYRFIRQMNTFDTEIDRNTCEDAFVRYTYDKPDLTQEEVDQYIELANQVVQGFKIQRRSEHMQGRLEEVTGNDSETMKISMGLVDAISSAANEYDQCIKRQQKLLDDLKEKRSTRLSKAIKDNASILNLVQEWRNEEYREKMLKLGELEQLAIANEIEKISSMSEIKARILGLSKEDILHG